MAHSLPSAGRARIRRLATSGLTRTDVVAIRGLMDAAFGDDPDERFTDDDWAHSLGGTHVVAEIDGEIVAHASVVPRTLRVGGRPLRTGYVEAVATVPPLQGLGVGSRVMRDVGDHIREHYELGALGTGSHRFYERLGWRTWQGPSSVLTDAGERPTPDDDGYIMVLPTPASPRLELTDPIVCEWRPGDVW